MGFAKHSLVEISTSVRTFYRLYRANYRVPRLDISHTIHRLGKTDAHC